TNLAPAMPAKVAELEALIEGFITDTGAAVPLPNPAFREKAAEETRAPTFGLVARQCELTPVEGALRVTATGKRAFIGTAQAKVGGDVQLVMRLRAPHGGSGKVTWKSAEQDDFPEEGQTLDYTLLQEPGWQDLELALPVEGIIGTLRLYFPLEDGAIEVEKIEVSGEGGKGRRWDFAQ